MIDTKKPRYRVPVHYVDVEVSLDDFDDEQIVEYLRHRGYSVIGNGSSSDNIDLDASITGNELDHIYTLSLCGQRQAAIDEGLQLLSRAIGRQL